MSQKQTFKLTDLFPVTRTVSVGVGELQVHGLSLKNIGALASMYGTALNGFLSGNLPDFNSVIESAPDAVATVICMGCDLDGQEGDAAKLPALAQIEILTAIWEETVPDVKKLKELLVKVLENIPKQPRPLPEPTPEEN